MNVASQRWIIVNIKATVQVLLDSTPIDLAGAKCQLQLVRRVCYVDGVAEKEFHVLLTGRIGQVVLEVGYTLEEGIASYMGYQMEDTQVLTDKVLSIFDEPKQGPKLTLVEEKSHD